jgi:hypothetical protein
MRVVMPHRNTGGTTKTDPGPMDWYRCWSSKLPIPESTTALSFTILLSLVLRRVGWG